MKRRDTGLILLIPVKRWFLLHMKGKCDVFADKASQPVDVVGTVAILPVEPHHKPAMW